MLQTIILVSSRGKGLCWNNRPLNWSSFQALELLNSRFEGWGLCWQTQTRRKKKTHIIVQLKPLSKVKLFRRFSPTMRFVNSSNMLVRLSCKKQRAICPKLIVIIIWALPHQYVINVYIYLFVFWTLLDILRSTRNKGKEKRNDDI